ncbi:hypothetical protein A8C56_00265 [Niabella ginsenosidivorans]|uniref:Outer membrane protein beta-barrel domain-containing protein n=1 Tax=Niabella ginsenosidivorans TaxID=1176587 RepID=A0A1A9HWK2_9BACT|nr:hypothetical protein [Niabella ginsenosidivorans]ANH79613.1 hypothetical protein A8C56_00265 [Niabella ginsenosidivorans]
MPFKIFTLTAVLVTITFSANAQQQVTEFTKGALLLIKLDNGFTTGFRSYTPDLYTGGLTINPQVTVIANTLRLGANAALAYNDKKASGLFGPMAALRLATIETKNYGSLANIHLIAAANWGTSHQQMAGGGIGVELLQKVQLGITAQRDYRLNNWWFQSFIGYQFNKRKKIVNEF